MLRIVEEIYYINDAAYEKAALLEIRPNAPLLPDGQVTATYDGERLILSDGKNQTLGELPWNGANELLADTNLAADYAAHTTPEEPEQTLEQIKAAAQIKIDRRAESARLKFITPGAAMAMVYQEKANEALKFSEDDTPEESDYPLLQAEVGITASTLQGVVDVILENRDAWKAIAAQIEGIRLTAKAAVRTALDAAAVLAIVEATVFNFPEQE